MSAMDTLIWIIISAAAAAFTSQLIGVLLPFSWYGYINGIITAPLAALALWLMGFSSWELLISAVAAGFLATATMKVLNRPVAVQTIPRGR